MKYLFLLYTLLFTTATYSMQKTEIGPNASTPVDQWRFELSNKSNLPITVSVLGNTILMMNL